MAITVKDFAKTLKISDKALIERMQKAGLSHSKESDEITASDKQALLKFLKGTKTQSKSVKSESGVTVTSKGKSSSAISTNKSYSDNIEAILPIGETLESTTHDTLGKDKISFEEVLERTSKYLIN